MSQINFRIQDHIEKFLSLKAKLENKSKTAVANEIFLKGINSDMMPYLAKLYQEGKISIKQISEITNHHFTEILDLIPKYIDDIEENNENILSMERLDEIFDSLIQNAKLKGISFDEGISSEKK